MALSVLVWMTGLTEGAFGTTAVAIAVAKFQLGPVETWRAA